MLRTIPAFLFAALFLVWNGRTQAMADPSAPAPVLRLYHAPDVVRLPDILAALQRASEARGLRTEVLDTSRDADFRRLLDEVGARALPAYSGAMLLAGGRVLAGHGEILPFLEDLAQGRIGLDALAPDSSAEGQAGPAKSPRFAAQEAVFVAPPAGATKEASPAGPPLGSWWLAGAVAAAGLVLGVALRRLAARGTR